MVSPGPAVARFIAVLGMIVAIGVALAGTSTAQPPTAPPPAPAPGATSTPGTPTTAAPAPGTTTTTPAPGTESAEQQCEGHIRIPGTELCTPIPDGVGSVVTDTSKAFLSDIVDAALNGFVWITKYIWQLFISVDVDMSNSTSTVQKINDMTGELQVLAAGLGLLVALMQILVHRMMLTGDNAAPEAFAGFLRWALAATLAAPTLLSLSQASEALAQWIFTTAAGPEGPTHVIDTLTAALSGRDERLKTEDVIALALCLLGLLAYVELAIQLFLQKAWMIYVAVALPIAGAASITGAGKSVFSAMLRLGVTVLLFKPIAALLFAVGFWQIRDLDSGFDVVTAVLSMVAPAFCMPVLVNLIGNTSVGFAGTPMLRGIGQIARPARRWAGNRREELRAGGRQAMDAADTRDEQRRSARAPSQPSTSRAPVTGSASPPPGRRAPSGPRSSAPGSAANSRNRAGTAGATAGARSSGVPGSRTGTGGGSRSGQSAASAPSSASGASGASSATPPGGRGRQSGTAGRPRPASSGGPGASSGAGARTGAASQRAGRSGGATGSRAGRTSADPTPTPQQRQSRRRAPTNRSGGPRDTLGRIE